MICTKPRYNIALNETLGSIHCGGVPMSIAVQTDMATPALARWECVHGRGSAHGYVHLYVHLSSNWNDNSCPTHLVYVAVGSVVDVELILRKGSGPMSWRRTFWSPLSWGIRYNQFQFYCTHLISAKGIYIKMDVHFSRFSYLLLSGGLSWC